MARQTRIHITLSSSSEVDIKILEFIGRFRTGRGVQERALELKKLILSGIESSAPSFHGDFQRNFPKASPIQRPKSDAATPPQTVGIPGTEVMEGNAGNNFPSGTEAGFGAGHKDTHIVASLQGFEELGFVLEPRAEIPPTEQPATK